jgi:hypothetical protein
MSVFSIYGKHLALFLAQDALTSCQLLPRTPHICSRTICPSPRSFKLSGQMVKSLYVYRSVGFLLLDTKGKQTVHVYLMCTRSYWLKCTFKLYLHFPIVGNPTNLVSWYQWRKLDVPVENYFQYTLICSFIYVLPITCLGL